MPNQKTPIAEAIDLQIEATIPTETAEKLARFSPELKAAMFWKAKTWQLQQAQAAPMIGMPEGALHFSTLVQHMQTIVNQLPAESHAKIVEEYKVARTKAALPDANGSIVAREASRWEIEAQAFGISLPADDAKPLIAGSTYLRLIEEYHEKLAAARPASTRSESTGRA
jgi:hypothetical protein